MARVAKAYETSASADRSSKADAIAWQYGITSSNGTATVYHSPQAGTGSCDLAATEANVGATNAFEVVVTQNSIPSYFGSTSSVSICGRAIAQTPAAGIACWPAPAA